MQTKLTFEVFIPTTSTARANDFILAFDKLVKEHKGRAPFVGFSGPYGDNFERYLGNERQPTDGQGPERAEHQRSAADDFSEEPADEPEAGGDGGGGGKPGRKPRSDAGKPRGPRGGKEAGASGSAAEGPERTAGGGKAGGSEGGAPRNGPGPATQGSKRGDGEGKGQDGGPSGRVGRTGDTHGGNDKASPVTAAEEDWDNESGDDWDAPADAPAEDLSGINDENDEEWWSKTPGDEWPDRLMPEGPITRTTLSSLMSDHFRAAGGKQKGPTFQLLDAVCGATSISAVAEADYDKLARALLKDTARYTYGVKKPLTGPAKS